MAEMTHHSPAAEVEADHIRLKASMSALVAHLETANDDAFPVWKRAFLLALRDFQGQLLRHFDLEEEGGFIDEIKRMAPQWMNRIEHVEVDHEEIRAEMRQIIRDLKDCTTWAAYSASECGRRVRELTERLHEHESVEMDLMQMAHNREYGSGD